MKRRNIFRIILICYILTGGYTRMMATNSESNPVALPTPYCKQVLLCSPSDSVRITLLGLTLHADSGSVIDAFTLSAERLPSTEAVAPMPSGMMNVTTGRAVYRLLPHGEHFIEPATLTMEYDPILLPHGYKPKDIYTCYYDTLAGRWIQLPRVKVDTLTHTIASLTTHFTDFANAIIKVPEMPETKAFVPTMMQDLPDIDPLDQIPMIAVPEANNNGTAELTYPIFVPQGRNGLQPSLALTYSSSNTGNGPLGVGWSLNMPAITIDTRWGVPRYDYHFETEAYTLNGQQLVMHEDDGKAIPLPHQSDHYEFSTHKTRRFYYRDTRMQDMIIRHGQHTKEYWWSVTDRQGVTTYYGGLFDPNHPEQMGLDTAAVLLDASRNIGYWAATVSFDLYGNYVRYIYHKDGNNLYIDSITYTGNYKEPLQPKFSIRFIWQDRGDVSSEARLGFLRKTTQRLCHLRCSYNNNPYRVYAMIYQEPSDSTLFKSRLKEVVMIDGCNSYLLQNFNPGCINVDIFASNHTWPGTRTRFSYQDAPVSTELFSTTSASFATPLPRISASSSKSWDIGGTLSVGIGPDVATTIMSVGGNYSYSRSEGKTKCMLMDLNGDGLPDQVYEDNGNVYYKKQLNNTTFSDPVMVNGLPCLSHEINETNDWGLQLDAVVANVSGGWPVTDSYTDTYFADVNGDGLPDLVTPECIRFNELDENENPVFSELTSNRNQSDETIPVNNSVCGQTTMTGEVDQRLLCRIMEYHKDFIPYRDLLPDDYEESVWRTDTFNGGETPDDSFYQYLQENNLISVHNLDGVITYYWDFEDCKKKSVNPNIEVVRVWVAPQNGTVQISGTAHMVSDTSYSHQQSQHADGVICYIQKSSNISFAGLKVASSTDTELTHMTLNDGDTLPHTISTITTVNAGDVILFRIFSCDNTDYDRVRWEQQVTYTSPVGQSYNSATDYVCVGKNNFVAPYDGSVKASVICNNDGGYPVVVNVRYCSVSGSQTDSCLTISPHASDTLICRYTNVSDSDSIRVWLSGSNVVWSDVHAFPVIDFTSDTIGQGRTITYYPDIHIQGVSPDLSPSAYLPSNLPEDKYRSLFGGTLYRGWGRFAYNWTAFSNPNNSVIPLIGLYNTSDSTYNLIHANDSIYQAKMTNVMQGMDSAHLSQFTIDSLENRIEQNGLYSPLLAGAWVEMTSDSRSERYIAYGQLGSINRYVQSNTRVTDNQLVFNDTLYQNVPSQPDIATYDSPFPKTETRGRLLTVRKSSRTEQTRLSTGISCGPLGLAYSETESTQTVETDYTDLNGDGFPDFIGSSNAIQYSTPWGGIGLLQITNLTPFENVSSSTGNTFSGSRDGKLDKLVGNGQTAGRFTIKETSGSVGISQGINTGNSSTQTTYMDINGDGLPDKVDSAGQTVAYNIGYKFLPPVSFNSLTTKAINDGLCLGASGGLHTGAGTLFENTLNQAVANAGPTSFSAAQVSISAGINASTSEDHTTKRLFDINGDGLPDLLSVSGNNVSVNYNTGGQFAANSKTINLSAIMANYSDNIGVNLGITGGFTFFLIVKLCAGLQSSPWAESYSQTMGDLIDMNGDGFPDWVEATTNGLAVRYHQGARTNLLTSVTNPTGQKITLDYTLSEPDTHHRQRQYNLTLVTDSDRLNPNPELRGIRTEIRYGKAHYDNYERTDYGYDTVITETGNKRLMQSFQNQAYMLHGEKTSDLLSDTAGVRYIGHRYSKGFFLGEPSQTIDTVPSALCQDADIHIQHYGDWTDWYEGHNSPQLSMLTQSFFDSLYNLVRFVHHGNYAVPGDEWTQNIDYATHYDHNLISLPIRERVTSAGTTLRKSEAEYNHYGSPERISMIDTATNITLSTYLTYDSLGLPIRAIYPTGMQLDITYDMDVHTYPSAVTNSFNEMTQILYDPRWGRPYKTIDPAGKMALYEYDSSGRLVEFRSPYLNTTARAKAIFLYHNRGHDLYSICPNSNYHEPDTFTYVIKEMYSGFEAQPDSELLIFDARGHELQRKRKMTVGGNESWVSSGHSVFDRFYRPLRQFYPSLVGSAPIQDYDPIVSPTCTIPTITQYDILDRPLSKEYPDHATEYCSYSVQNNALKTLITDANGNTQEVFKSPQDWTLCTREGTDSLTKYQYNPIGELIRVTDAEGYRTDYAYDMFGHTIMRSHPDNGTTRWFYNSEGLLEHLQTQRLYNKSQSIDYKYNHGRLTDISTPNSSYIHYDYNSAGRIAKRWDASGTEEFTYDSLGNVSRSIRRLVVPTENNAYVFQTDYLYDGFGRMRQITYPDGEQVNYQYGRGGLLSDMVSTVYGPICHRKYDERGRRIYQLYGNGTETVYGYSDERDWLTHLDIFNGSGMFSSKGYVFDPVGNIVILEIQEGSSPSIASWITFFTYDNRNRLVQAHDPYDYNVTYSPTGKIWHKGYFNPPTGSVSSTNKLYYGYDADTLTHQPRVIYDDESASAIDLFWDADGNLAQIQDCKHERTRFHRWNDFDRLTFSLGHDFCGYYGYDADGIRTYKLMGTCNISTQNGGGLQAQAIFDDMVLYPSPYMVVTPRGYTNHYYAGSERIASRIGDRCWTITATDEWEKPSPEEEALQNFWNIGKEEYPFGEKSDYNSPTTNTTPINGYEERVQYDCTPVELPRVDILHSTDMLGYTINCDYSYQNDAPVYYYHPDHLGSTSWVTNFKGNEHQFIAYLPYGEPLLNVLYDNYDSRYGLIKDARYKFTGKERDAETGYDYMEQRYYYPPLSIWLRPDPLLDKYIHLSPYAYCNGNPQKYVDPEGMYFDDANEKKAQEISSNIQAQMKGTIGGRRKELKQSLQDIEDMRNDADYEYQFIATNDDRAQALGINEKQPQTGKGLSNEDNANKNANGHQVIGMFYIAKDYGSLLHEARHGGQHARREMNVLTKEGYSLASEVDAYRAQWGWSGILVLPILHAHNLSRNITIEYRYEIDESLIRQITEDLTNPTLIYQSLTK